MKIAPALAAGNCTVVKPASPTPWSILKLAEVIADVVLPGVLNIVNGPARMQGACLQQAHRQDRLHRRDRDRSPDHAVRGPELIPSSTELGGKSPNIFFEDVMAADDAFLDKDRGPRAYAFNKGEVCTPVARAHPGVDL